MVAAEQFQWVSADGATHRLDSGVDGVYVVETVSGRFMPVMRRTDEVVPLQPGQRLRAVLHDQREVTIGLLFVAADAAVARTLLRTWLGRFDPTRGDGKLIVTDPAGTQRQLTCRYESGLEMLEDSTTRDPGGAQLAVVTFLASDPYWSDTTDSQHIWTAGAATTFFPIFPMRLGASQVLGSASITNTGDVESYPTWVVKGPAAGFTLSNVTTGRTLQWGGTLGAAEYVVVDTRPGNQSQLPKSVFKNDGTNVFGLLSAWDFWPFEPGGQTVDVEMAGATGGSQVTAVWRNRYLSA